MGTPVAGRVGVGAVGAGHPRPARDRLAGPPAAPSRPARPGPGNGWRRARAGGPERDHGRGGPGQPPPNAPGRLAATGARPAASYVALYGPATLGAMLGCIGFTLLLTPTGSLPSPRWRWWARVMVAAPVVSLVATLLLPNSLHSDYQTLDNPLALRAFGGALRAALWVALAITVSAVLVAAGSLVVRFRRAHGVERQQLRWVALAAALMVLAGPVVLVPVAL